MTGKTHVAAGIAAGLLCTLPDSVTELSIAVGAGYFGGVISDLDIEGSKAQKAYMNVLGSAVLLLADIGVAEQFTNISILSYLWQQASALHCITGILMLLILCVFGSTRKHRTFLHSLPAVALIGMAVHQILPAAAIPVMAGMLSHILLDLLNKKKVSLLYPLRKFGRCSLHLCHANGIVDKLLCLLCSLLAFGLLLWKGYSLFRH